MAFSRETVAAVKERADIVEVVGERMRLTPSGSDFVGLCPFHGEKTPSFRVNPSWRTYHCFGCGTGGSVIDFIMALENRSFPETVTLLAERYGVPLPQSGGSPDRNGPRSIEALGFAREYYHGILISRPEGEAARRYLRERDFDEPDWKAFGLGFALDEWQDLLTQGRSQGFSEEDLLESGVVRAGNSGRLYDMLRKRVVFPILNDLGRPIAFGGRVIESGDAPKYINTPETRHYRKGNVLFGLAQGREALRQSRRALLVEGYLDVMRLHQHGFRDAVATCGTALTEGHLNALQRHADKAVLLFDGDEAGIKAALRSAPLFLNQGMEARVVLLPDGMDPDDFLLRQGSGAFSALLEEAPSLLEFLVFQMLKRNGNTPLGKEQTLDALVPVLGQVRKPAARDLAVRFLCDLIGVKPETVLSTLSRPGRGGGDTIAAPASTYSRKEERHQRKVLRLLLEQPALISQVRERLAPEELTDPELRRLMERLLGFSDEEFVQVTPDQLMDWYPETAPALRGILMEPKLHHTAISDFQRELESEIYCIKDSLKESLFLKLKSLEDSQELEQAVRDYRKISNDLKSIKNTFRSNHPLGPDRTVRVKPPLDKPEQQESVS